MNLKNAFWIINEVAEENGYEIIEVNKENYQLHLGKFHGVDYEISANSSGYIQCKQWDENREEYNRSVYSLRGYSDIVSFCTILINSASIRAKRN